MYLTIEGQAKASYEIQHSVFICHIKHIESYEEGIEFVKIITKKYSDATHNCYAIHLQNGQQKFYDDGEPQGTAGMPILQVLKQQELYDVVAIVTRYYGGVKLGANGLVSSYSKATTDAVCNANIITKKTSVIGEINCSYAEYQNYLRQFQDIENLILDTIYDEEVSVKFGVPIVYKDRAEEIVALVTSGGKKINWTTTKYLTY